MSTESENRRFLVYVQVPSGAVFPSSSKKMWKMIKQNFTDKDGEEHSVLFFVSIPVNPGVAKSADLAIVCSKAPIAIFGFERMFETKCVFVPMNCATCRFQVDFFFPE